MSTFRYVSGFARNVEHGPCGAFLHLETKVSSATLGSVNADFACPTKPLLWTNSNNESGAYEKSWSKLSNFAADGKFGGWGTANMGYVAVTP
eukprot:1005882-Rhodomonas_salina.2